MVDKCLAGAVLLVAALLLSCFGVLYCMCCTVCVPYVYRLCFCGWSVALGGSQLHAHDVSKPSGTCCCLECALCRWLASGQ